MAATLLVCSKDYVRNQQPPPPLWRLFEECVLLEALLAPQTCTFSRPATAALQTDQPGIIVSTDADIRVHNYLRTNFPHLQILS